MLEERTFGPVTTTSAPNGTNQAGLVNTATGAAGALAGWAISSLSKQLAVSEIHSTMSATSSLAPPNGSSSYSTPATSPRPSSDVSSVFGQANVSSSASLGPSAFGQTSGSSRLKGVKPAANGARGGTPQRGTKSNPIADAVAGEWEDGDEVANAWGTDDLIDVNADADDWGESITRTKLMHSRVRVCTCPGGRSASAAVLLPFSTFKSSITTSGSVRASFSSKGGAKSSTPACDGHVGRSTGQIRREYGGNEQRGERQRDGSAAGRASGSHQSDEGAEREEGQIVMSHITCMLLVHSMRICANSLNAGYLQGET